MDKLDRQMADLKRLLDLKKQIKYFQNQYNRNGTGYKFLEILKAEFRGIQESMKENS